MRSDCFLDTNILIYAAAGRKSSPHKFAIAAKLVGNERFGISGQVRAEFYVNVLTRPAVPLSVHEAVRWIDLLSAYPVAAIDEILPNERVDVRGNNAKI